MQLQHQQSFTVDVAVLFCQSKAQFRSLEAFSTSASALEVRVEESANVNIYL